MAWFCVSDKRERERSQEVTHPAVDQYHCCLVSLLFPRQQILGSIRSAPLPVIHVYIQHMFLEKCDTSVEP
jgi:hypothetical protein